MLVTFVMRLTRLIAHTITEQHIEFEVIRVERRKVIAEIR